MDSQSSQHFYAQQRPAYPQASYNQSNFTSSASLSSLASINTSPDQTNMSSRQSPTLVSAAPVSSPSSQSQFSLPPSMNQENNYYQQMPQFSQQQQHRGSFSEEQRPSGLNDTSPFLQDFSLLAEAAKRAQMACMMRDFDDLDM
ncbi:hypothetical protein E4T42_01430 [Aureobasidium subglaciale]|uniref:Uncharacterized protein n=1 Tax=Aureobasidium subglaciale (strain EXF-2481) TaxID=1043005 RepID=A0A074Z2Z2_AURSE|nr:uncharacterized protein AUEXF2481DRAFT_24937 [Aureobasidium subglaciale EXF-2481]KAI5210184.1 hypothetical protein E4T38_02146 [Aureobasidium subglaciale]KAI5228982.1 hypothetical protein E4T40_01748 [Aureobasidium subglaciale]KAI5232762.1 hypothetical protein E4T41_01968 [Aureobasidium subglaciale]KAI5256841.1 hypothetical protein E4T42_01430 [Aureobasidium subglaciale]KAI5266131.1 hypothetical protein E4T46_01923 [Aureobasidium subglaciale]